jgi:hypothetical protein
MFHLICYNIIGVENKHTLGYITLVHQPVRIL